MKAHTSFQKSWQREADNCKCDNEDKNVSDDENGKKSILK